VCPDVEPPAGGVVVDGWIQGQAWRRKRALNLCSATQKKTAKREIFLIVGSRDGRRIKFAGSVFCRSLRRPEQALQAVGWGDQGSSSSPRSFPWRPSASFASSLPVPVSSLSPPFLSANHDRRGPAVLKRLNGNALPARQIISPFVAMIVASALVSKPTRPLARSIWTVWSQPYTTC
jgi:hypothetical protein